MNMCKWTRDDTEYLRQNFGDTPPEKLAKVLNRSIDAINKKAYNMGLKAKPNRCIPKIWTKDDEDFVRQNYNKMDSADIAKKLNRSVAAIKQKACALGLTKRQMREKADLITKFKENPPPWREETSCTAVCICSSVIRGQKLVDIAIDLYRPLQQVEEVYERSLTDGTYNRVKKYLESPSFGYVDSGDKRYKLAK